MSENMNIFQRMMAVTKEIKAVAKNLEVGYGKNSYKATGEADVLFAVKNIEVSNGIYSYPYKREIIDQQVLTTKGIDYKVEKTQFYLRMKTTYRFVNVDKPEEFVDIESYSDGLDNADKATGKAMTYGDKYALMKAYKIVTGEDPDQYQSEEFQEVVVDTKKTEEFQEVVEEVAEDAKKTEATRNEYIGDEQFELFQQELKNNGLDPKKVCIRFEITRKADMTWGKLHDINSKLKQLKKDKSLLAEATA